MQVLRHLSELPASLRRGAVSIGNFDGVHVGHRQIVARLVETAATGAGAAIVFTFDPHPGLLLRPGAAPQPLVTPDLKAKLLAALGVDALVVYPTDRALLELSPQQFLQQMIVERLGARAMVEGPNFRFGRDRLGDVALLRQLCKDQGISLEIVESVLRGEEAVSSSRIRGLIGAGDVCGARSMLGRPYRISGTVIAGARRGASIGFPTANLDAIATLLPAAGVYAGYAAVCGDHASETRHPAAVNIGPNPTFGESALKVEAHLADYHGDLYGRTLTIDFLAKLRETERFKDIASLKAQLAVDVSATRDAFRVFEAGENV